MARKARFHKEAVISAVVFTMVVFFLLPRRRVFNRPPPEASEEPLHPIQLLHQEAIRDFEALLSQQSQSPDEAAIEYEERYGRPPPPGFKEWAKYALRQRSPIIDEFDTIFDNVDLFHQYSPDELQHLMEEATAGDNEAVTLCSFTKTDGFQGCAYFGDVMDWIFGDAKKHLPNMKVPVNTLDEPSVLLVNDATDEMASEWPNLAHQSLVDQVAEACRVVGETTVDRLFPQRVESFGLPFVQSVDEEKDLCLHPEYKDYHGFLNSPTSFRQLRTAVPLLSRAAPYPFADVLMPSPHYAFPHNLYSEVLDKPWHRKKNAVFWHGSTTGGHWHKDTPWRQGHRQRLAILANMHTKGQNYTYLQPTNNTWRAGDPWRAYTSPKIDRALYDVHISAAMQCDDDECEEQARFFRIDEHSSQPAGQPYQYRFAFDIDGNSYSGRFHKHLAGHTTPLKMSIFKEWHDERLVPWLHYVPVSQSMDELPELVRFLATTDEGQDVAFRIAEEGRKWYYRALTPVHQGLYLYRLFLELAWLLDPERPVE
ncbi:hypothetical protein Daus18300_013888 [Diaporthe australafricana]|uniref:Glycosyl transferase CAP10 domain-containing protein n=1 Tax=Diaporthe australafricana TaxID=127596 RepID=A0ABR3VXE2_9PEZI